MNSDVTLVMVNHHHKSRVKLQGKLFLNHRKKVDELELDYDQIIRVRMLCNTRFCPCKNKLVDPKNRAPLFKETVFFIR